jgi:hypothetical protein
MHHRVAEFAPGFDFDGGNRTLFSQAGA